MSWIEVTYDLPGAKGNTTQTVLLNLDHVRAVKKRSDGRAMVLFSSGSVPAVNLVDTYVDVMRKAEQRG